MRASWEGQSGGLGVGIPLNELAEDVPVAVTRQGAQVDSAVQREKEIPCSASEGGIGAI